MAKIFVLGSNSFAGTSLIDFFLHQECEVMGVSRSPEAPGIFNPYAKNHHRARFQFFQKNINTDFTSVISLIKDFKPDFVVDLAGQSMSSQSWEHPLHWYQTNVLTKVRLYEELRQMKFLKRFLRISPPDVYGENSSTLSENAALNPKTPYAISHATQDMTLRAYFEHHGFPSAVIRSSYFYGPHQQLYRLIPRIIIAGRLGSRLTLASTMSENRAFIHIWDFCEAVWKVLNQGKNGEIYHVGSTEKLPLQALVEKISEKIQVDAKSFVKIEGIEKENRSYDLDDRKIKSTLQWEPQVTLDDGIEQVISWVDQNLAQIKSMPLEYVHKE